MKISSIILKLTMALLLVVNLAGCDEDDGPAAISYSGLTTAAVIDSDNADDLAAGAIEGGQATSVIENTDVLGAAVQVNGSGPVGYSRVMAVSELLLSSLDQLDLSDQSNGVSAGTVTTDTTTVYGTCDVGGSADITLRFDDVSLEFSGKVIYNDYCENDVKISGTAQLEGDLDDTNYTLSLDFSFDQLSVNNGVDSITLDGDISIVAPLFQDTTITTNLTLKDNTAEKVYKLENYVMVVTDHFTYVEAVVSGKYYDPDYGYVDLSTESNFFRMKTEKHAYAGALLVTGHEGASGGNSQAMITALDATSYLIFVDADGDGNFEWCSDAINWPVAD